MFFYNICYHKIYFIISLLINLNKKHKGETVQLESTFETMLIALIVIKFDNSSGVHFKELEFLTHPPEKSFYIELLIGTLGAIMDIEISISSSINEIFNKNPDIKKNYLLKVDLRLERIY